jgi:hypothetical protein
MTLDGSVGILYVADGPNNCVRQVAIASGTVTTLAGSNSAGFVDGAGTSATFNQPGGVAINTGRTHIFVADTANHLIRRIEIASRTVTTVAGIASVGGFADSALLVPASFNSPSGIVADSSGNLFVADTANHRIRQIDASATVTTLAGNGAQTSVDGIGTDATFSSPINLAIDSSGQTLFVADAGTSVIRSIAISSKTVTRLVGFGTAAFANGVGSNAAFFFSGSGHMAVDASGNLFVADAGNHRIRKVVISTQVVTTIAGSGSAALTNGLGASAAFKSPSSVAVDASGNLFVGDTGNFRVRVVQAAPAFCPIGSFCPNTGMSAQTPCTAGSYCATTGLQSVSGSCSAGNYCPQGSSSSTQTQCTPGNYCPSGSGAQVTCPASSFCATAGLSIHTLCTAGSYCATQGLSIVSGPCTGGYYCTAGSSSATQNQCPVGVYCPEGSSATVACPAGSVCATAGLSNYTLCAVGSFCNRTGLSAVTGFCGVGTYCPVGSILAQPCTAGFYCPSGVDRFACIPGFYCPSGLSAVDRSYICIAGSYCPGGSTAQTGAGLCSMGTWCSIGSTAASGNGPCLEGGFLCAPGSVSSSGGGTFRRSIFIFSFSGVSTGNLIIFSFACAVFIFFLILFQ